MKRFTNLVNEVVDTGVTRGINLFMENLEAEIQKNLFLENNGISETISALFVEDAKPENNKADLIDI